ncbi:MAG: response regulator transcription factor [Firmicutes bacterium]|nr:response regulator transcription factor [Bacillota bacterium]
MKILMIEDEKRLSEAIARILKANNYLVDLAFDGEYGLECALTDTYDIIILDVMLPKLDGISVLRELRNHRIVTPVILLTAKGETEDKILGLDSGADDYLAKPFSTEELLARLRALGRRKENLILDGILTVGDVELRPNTLCMVCASNSVKLTAKEYQVMELLMMRKGMVTPKSMMIEKIWGFDSDVDEHSVEVYISFLRKKLGLIKAELTIQAERGAGYTLQEKG